jgi:DNA-binding ferritin-like protein
MFDQFKKIVFGLQALYGLLKNLHYHFGSAPFYGNHIFMDRIIDELVEIEDNIDNIQEVIFLGRRMEAIQYREIFEEAAKLVPEINAADVNTIRGTINLIENIIITIESLIALTGDQKLSTGENNLLSGIAQGLQQSKGLLSRLTKDIEWQPRAIEAGPPSLTFTKSKGPWKKGKIPKSKKITPEQARKMLDKEFWESRDNRR